MFVDNDQGSVIDVREGSELLASADWMPE